ncbi:hypothetical protein HMPREF3038_01207 [Akkermansia sp. KLE1797]|nr:hypothetical protein HMPREF3038_01207 [Akkermansia sp. KLE1797]KXU52883.1 hypothetical protein HMPREF3039_03049 [Akkermansia sp. KLE1798]
MLILQKGRKHGKGGNLIILRKFHYSLFYHDNAVSAGLQDTGGAFFIPVFSGTCFPKHPFS